MSKLAEVQERRKKAFAVVDELRKKHAEAGGKWADAESEKRWSDVNAEYDAALKEETDLRNAAKVESRFKELKDIEDRGDEFDGRKPGQDDRRQPPRRKKADDETRAIAMQGWLRAQQGVALKKSHIAAMQRCGIQAHCRDLNVPLCRTEQVKKLRKLVRAGGADVEERALSTINSSLGAITVPDGFISQLEVNMLHYSGMLQVADMLRTDSGNDINWPTADDTSNEGDIVGENTDVSATADPAFAAVNFGAYKFRSKMVKVPYELLEDSAFDMVSFLSQALGERLGRAINRKTTTGTGASEPKGVVTAATLGKTAASSTAITAGELINLFHSVDVAYRSNAYWMMNDSILEKIRLLVDSQNRPLFLDNYGAGFYPTINGRPYVINTAMDSALTTGKKVVLFGDFSKYKIRMVRSTRLRRLVERYADYDQEGFIAFLRADGNLVDAGTAPIKYLKMA